jgi:hypothetical protein
MSTLLSAFCVLMNLDLGFISYVQFSSSDLMHPFADSTERGLGDLSVTSSIACIVSKSFYLFALN